MTTPKLQKTKNYSLFELHEHNREYRRDPQLAQSMAKYGFMPSHPVHVQKLENGNLKIIAGHHRFDEAKRQGLEVWYIVDDTPASIFELEGSAHSAWAPGDFVTAHRRAGNLEYQVLDAFRKKHGYNIAIAAALVGGESAGSGNKARLVKSGNFRVGDMTHAKQVAVVTDAARQAGIGFATQSAFVAAVSAALRVEEVSASRLVDRISKHPHKLKKASRRNEYLSNIEDIYNYMASAENCLPIVILAKRAMASRNPGKRAS